MRDSAASQALSQLEINLVGGAGATPPADYEREPFGGTAL